MALIVEGDEARRLAEKIAELTGQSVSDAVTIALRQRLERLEGGAIRSLAERLLQIGGDCAVELKEHWRSSDHGDILYDDNGLPR